MMQDWLHHFFFVYLCSAKKDRAQTSDIMKKILLLIAAIAMLSVVVSCSDDDDPRGNGVFTVNTPMINHVYNTITGEVLGLSNTHNKLTIDTGKHTAALELVYNNDGSDQTLVLKDVIAKPKRPRFYELSSPSNAQFSGYVDFNEGCMRYIYTTESGLQVISTNSEVFFLKTNNKISYNDTTTTTDMSDVMYVFTFTPSMDNAIVKVMGIVHAKDVKYFNYITAMSVPYTVTPNGYVLSGQNIPTSAQYKSTIDSTYTTVKTTTDYPFKTFDATIDLINDNLDAVYMMGSSATVVATGRTYPDYTSY